MPMAFDPLSASALGTAQRMKTSPIPVQRTNRPLAHRVLTSLPAGKMVPMCVIPLLREDSISNASFRVSFEMSETVELLMNAVNVRLFAYLVPKLAFDRFHTMDDINRSYEGVQYPDGRTPPVWFETYTESAPGDNKIHYYLGKHARIGQTINTDYIETYNQIWNYRAKNRSRDITLRGRLDALTLAPAFWAHQTFAHIVPDFDQAVIDGQVPLNVVASRMPVKGIGIVGVAPFPVAQNNLPVAETGGTGVTTYPTGYFGAFGANVIGTTPGASLIGVKGAVPGAYFPDIWAELAENGISVSLSNIELARKTQAFARLRSAYAGHSEEYLIDLLMDGLSIPDQAWQQPMLLAEETTVFGMNKRYASDGASLTESVVNGLTFIDLRFSCPRVPMSGVVMICAEITPEQLFERQKDPYFTANSVDDLPHFLRDTLDPEKVEVVPNDAVDVDHDTPNDTFGYAPLNWSWSKSMPQVGGKFFRPQVDAAFDEDRQRIWAVETQNPVLSTDFYLVNNIHYKPFVVTDLEVDPFEGLLRGQCNIRGNTVFGPALVEASDDYAEVMEEADTDRIDKPATTAAGGQQE